MHNILTWVQHFKKKSEFFYINGWKSRTHSKKTTIHRHESLLFFLHLSPSLSWTRWTSLSSPIITRCASTDYCKTPQHVILFFSLSTLLPTSALLKDGQIVYSTLHHLCCIGPAGIVVPFWRDITDLVTAQAVTLPSMEICSLPCQASLSSRPADLKITPGEILQSTMHGGMFFFKTKADS